MEDKDQKDQLESLEDQDYLATLVEKVPQESKENLDYQENLVRKIIVKSIKFSVYTDMYLPFRCYWTKLDR